MPEERKLATILFADVVGSTALGSTRDPEVMRAALARMFERMRQIIVAHGGTVEKFIGDEVMAVFGVPTAHEDDAERAVRTAFALHEASAKQQDAGTVAFTLRIGLDSGEVVAETGARDQFLVTGDAVIRAARLRQAAKPGGILVGPLARDLTAAHVRYGPIEKVEAKGLGIVEAATAESVVSEVPEQRRGIAGLPTTFVGREAELAELLSAAERVRAQRRALAVTVLGPPGAGKSRLAAELINRIDPAAARRGRCLPYGDAAAFWPLREILRTDAGIAADEPADEAVRKLQAAVRAASSLDAEESDAVARRLAVICGLERPEAALAGVQSDQVMPELRWGLRRYLEARTVDEMLLIVVEDIHWAEPALLDLLEHVFERTEGQLLVLCLARPDLLEKRPAWGRGKRRSLLELEPLSPDETRLLVAQLLESEALPADLREQLVRRAQGNPLFVEELIRMLIEQGRIVREADRWVAIGPSASLDIPPSVQAVIAARLDALAPGVRGLLQHAAVVGRVFWSSALSSLDVGPSTASVELLDEAVRRGLVSETGERGPRGGWAYEFSHALIRDVAYGSLPKSQRLSLHDRLGRWLEALGDEYADVVAHHAEQAFILARELQDPRSEVLRQRAFTALVAAGRRARRRDDLHATASLYGRAVELAAVTSGSSAEVAEAHTYSAIARDRLGPSGDTARRLEAALAVARRNGPSEVLVDVLIRVAIRKLNDAPPRARPFYDEAIAAARAMGSAPLLVRALTFAHWAPMLEGDAEEARRLLAEARELTRSNGLTGELIDCLMWLAQLDLFQGRFAEARSQIEEATKLTPGTSSTDRRLRLLLQRVHLAGAVGDTAGERQLAMERLEIAKRYGDGLMLAISYAALGRVLRDEGDLLGSRRVLEEGLELADVSARRLGIGLRGTLALTCLALGDTTAARKHIEAAVLTDQRRKFLRAQLAEAEGRVTDADEGYRESLGGLRWSERVRALFRFAEFLIRQGRVDEARPLLEEVRAFYADPLAAKRREEVDALLRSAAAAPAKQTTISPPSASR